MGKSPDANEPKGIKGTLEEGHEPLPRFQAEVVAPSAGTELVLWNAPTTRWRFGPGSTAPGTAESQHNDWGTGTLTQGNNSDPPRGQGLSPPLEHQGWQRLHLTVSEGGDRCQGKAKKAKRIGSSEASAGRKADLEQGANAKPDGSLDRRPARAGIDAKGKRKRPRG